jgi:hypothetical protein
VQALRTATIKILSIDEDWQRINLSELDLEEQFDRFETLRRLDYSTGSLKNYKSRLKHAVGMYLAWLRKGPDWKSYGPGTRNGGANKNGKAGASRPTSKSPAKVTETPHTATPAPAPAPDVSPQVSYRSSRLCLSPDSRPSRNRYRGARNRPAPHQQTHDP